MKASFPKKKLSINEFLHSDLSTSQVFGKSMIQLDNLKILSKKKSPLSQQIFSN